MKWAWGKYKFQLVSRLLNVKNCSEQGGVI